jgi:hypothetical protein
MKIHGNARTCPHSRLLLCQRVVEQGWSLAQTAEAAGVSTRTAAKWLGRFRVEGEAGLADRSSPRVRSRIGPLRSGSSSSPRCGDCG